MPDCLRRFGVDPDASSLQDALDRIVSVVASDLGLNGGAAIALWNPNRNAFVAGSSTVRGQVSTPAFRRLRRRGASSWLIEEERELVVHDIASDGFGANDLLPDAGNNTYAGVRLESELGASGVLYAMNTAANSLKESIAGLHHLGWDASHALHALLPLSDLAEVNVLVVDDETLLRESLALRVRQLPNVRVTSAGSGSEALRCARLNPPDLVLLDVNLGAENGYDVGERLREELLFHRFDVVVMTGDRRSIDETRAKHINARATLEKPFDVRRILDIVEDVRSVHSSAD